MITISSHGFKYGRPEANYFFDVSYFKNPWRVDKIRFEKDKEKRKKMILEYMEDQKECDSFINVVGLFLKVLNQSFPEENIKVAFCCSAGEYRSPAIAELVAKELKEFKVKTIINHSKESKL